MKAAAIVVFFLVIPSVCFAATIYVPDDHGTIQAAINAAADGDTVVVRAGTYLENIDFVGKAITVKSESGPRRTVIDGTRSGSVVTFQSGEGPGSVLEGFSVTNGLGAVNPYRTGGGVHCESASPTLSGNFISGNEAGDDGAGILCDGNCFPVISGNTLTANRASRYGGAIYCYLSSPDIVDNVIMANRAISRGGGIYCSDSSPMISGNLFHGNTTDGRGGALYFKYCDDEPLIVSNLISWNGAAGSGGGIYCQNEPSLRLVGNTLTENYSGTGGGIYCLDSSAILTNTIVWNNTATQDPEIYATSASALVVTYCDVRGGWTGTGNIDADPLFVDPAASDYHIPFDSPCRSAGDRNAQGLPEHDFEGDPRNGRHHRLAEDEPGHADIGFRRSAFARSHTVRRLLAHASLEQQGALRCHAGQRGEGHRQGRVDRPVARNHDSRSGSRGNGAQQPLDHHDRVARRACMQTVAHDDGIRSRSFPSSTLPFQIPSACASMS